MGRGPRLVVAGAVFSTRRILTNLVQHQANVVGVLGLDPAVSRGVSGYARLDGIAAEADIPFAPFRRMGDPDVIATLRAWEPDVLFAVGLSQLVGPEVRAIPRLGTVGFHPTALPRGRGRAPLAWLVLREREGASTFFVIDEGVDSGPILAQGPFTVAPDDDASTVSVKIEDGIDRALDTWIPRLIEGEWAPVPQDETHASFYGKRSPVDGLIDWSSPAPVIERLVKAATRPHPGAYTHHADRVLRIWRATTIDEPVEGVPSRVVGFDDGRPIVQTGAGLLRLDETSWDGGEGPAFTAGLSLGYRLQHQVHTLRARIASLEARLLALEERT